MKNYDNKIITIPNIITTIRIAGSCFLTGYLMKNGMSNFLFTGPFFAAVAATDGVDGYIARKFNQTSELGKVLDPIADKVLNWGVGLVLITQGIIPAWSLTIGARDLYVGIKSKKYMQENKKILLPTLWGKAKMFLQSTSLASTLFFGWNPISIVLMANAVSVASGDTNVLTKLFNEARTNRINKESLINNNEETNNFSKSPGKEDSMEKKFTYDQTEKLDNKKIQINNLNNLRAELMLYKNPKEALTKEKQKTKKLGPNK